MKPLNRAERNNAFLGFLLLFVITIGIVITVVFFSIKVQFSENERLRSKVLTIENERNLTDSFRVAMDVALNELTNYDSKVPAIVVKGRVDTKIDRMRRLIKNMADERSIQDKSMYDLIIQNIADLNVAKAKIRNLEDDKN